LMNTSSSIQPTSSGRRSTSSLLVTFAAALFAAIVLHFVAVERTDAQTQVEVWAWGDNAFGQLGTGTTQRNTPTQLSGFSDVQTIAGVFYHSLALKSDGTVWTWGRNDCGQLGNGTNNNSNTPVQVNGLSGVQDIDGGGNHSLAVTSSDTTPPPSTDPVPGPPTVESTIPSANKTTVAPKTSVTATFSEAMGASTTDGDASTINGNTFKLFKKGSTTKIATAVNYDDATDTATLDPTNNLRSGVTCKAVITTGVEDTAGNSLSNNSTSGSSR
jgi:Bacterial Ig-like domain/Regulator of chromosome condensation (RCC1) repeat